MLLAASVLALGFAACAPENPASEAVPTDTAARDGTSVNETSVDSGVTNFVEKATVGYMFEVEAGRIALERSQVQPVKDFAQQMVDGHAAALTELSNLSLAAQVSPPSALDNDHMRKLDALRKASVEEFDDIYVDQQTEAHQNTLNLLRGFASNGKNAGLQAFVTKVTPKVEQHLTAVKALEESEADEVTDSPSKT